MRRICVVGTGYVGLVTGACFAELGNEVVCIDVDAAKVESLRQGIIPIYEPGLEDLVKRNMHMAKRLSFTTLYDAVRSADYVFMCVGTPPGVDSAIDLSFLHRAYMQTVQAMGDRRPVIVNKSTVPPGTADMMQTTLTEVCNGKGAPSVVSNPEFLREGHAVHDFMHPSRVVIGARSEQDAAAVEALYQPLKAPMIVTDTRTAEMIKYASNAFLATKISFINEIAALCERLGTDVDDVATGIGLDPRIGKDFLKAGIGYGGSCLPKDIGVLTAVAREAGYEPLLLNAVAKTNSQQVSHVLEHLRRMVGKDFSMMTVAVLGLTFKAHTDDLRSSPAMEIVKALRARGVYVRAYDPQAWRRANELQGVVECFADPYAAALDADAVVVATEWPEFKDIDPVVLRRAMRGDVLVDGRNILQPRKIKNAGFRYVGIGRGREAIVEQAPSRNGSHLRTRPQSAEKMGPIEIAPHRRIA